MRCEWISGWLLVSTLAACATNDATMAVVDNGYAGSTAVYKAWWAVALFADPVAAGATSEPVRVVPGSDFAYALLAPGWDSTSQGAPISLVPVRTKAKLSVERGGTLHVVVSDATTMGNCAAGDSLSTEDAAFIVERIFPGEFADVTYDPATCTATPADRDGGTSDAMVDGLPTAEASDAPAE